MDRASETETGCKIETKKKIEQSRERESFVAAKRSAAEWLALSSPEILINNMNHNDTTEKERN